MEAISSILIPILELCHIFSSSAPLLGSHAIKVRTASHFHIPHHICSLPLNQFNHNLSVPRQKAYVDGRLIGIPVSDLESLRLLKFGDEERLIDCRYRELEANRYPNF